MALYRRIIDNSCDYLNLNSYWSSKGRSFVMRSLKLCPENFSQNVVDYPSLLRGGIYYAKSEVLELESNLLISKGGGG